MTWISRSNHVSPLIALLSAATVLMTGCSVESPDNLSPDEADAQYVALARSAYGFAVDDEQLADLGRSFCEGLREESPTSMQNTVASTSGDLEMFYVALAAAPAAYCSDKLGDVAAFFSVGAAGDDFVYLADLAQGNPVSGGELTPKPYTACQTAMQAAADVALSQVNDTQFAVTLADCGDVDEWERALKRFPGALGMSNPTSADIANTLRAACAPDELDSQVCVDARSNGILTQP